MLFVYLCCLSFTKLYMPEGFEKADKNAKLSPTIGKPRLPGIPSISFGEAIDRIKKKNESKNTAKSTMVNKMLSSIVSLCITWQLKKKKSYVCIYQIIGSGIYALCYM